MPIADLRTLDEVMNTARSRPRFLTLLLTHLLDAFAGAGRARHLRRDLVLGRPAHERDRNPYGPGRAIEQTCSGWWARPAFAWQSQASLIGAVGALALTRTMSGLLFGVSSFDPATFLLMAGALAGVTLVACYIPARRAAKVDPLIALRYE